jgi:hypothetical protein
MSLVSACRRSPWIAALFFGSAVPGSSVAQDTPAPAIADNSFLIEEAYNQEPGIVQHISTFVIAGKAHRDLFYTLTQEWPFRGQRHQLSFTLPVTRLAERSSGIGDVLLNYRTQLGSGGRRWALAPRLSIVLPTGSVSRGYGNGSPGLQVNLPVSYAISTRVVMHWNAGATVLPWAKGPLVGGRRQKRTLTTYALGTSLIAPTDLPVQLLVENLVIFEGALTAGGGIARSTSWIVSPGARAAINLGNLQIVPGVALPFTRSEGVTDRDFLFYLSFEHPFRTQPAPQDTSKAPGAD